MMLYKHFTSQEAIDRQYNVAASVGGYAAHAKICARESEAVRQRFRCEANLRYGPTLDETVDVFPAVRPGAPLVVFIHGGYWQRPVTTREFAFVARELLADGAAVAIPNYSLCPKVTIDEIVRQNRAAVAWLVREAERFNADPARLVVCGHSAGGHLTAMLLCTDWAGEYGMPPDTIKGGLAISGLFDLRPFVYSWLQPKLQLAHQTVVRQSPLFQVPSPEAGPDAPLVLAVGGDETEEFHRQAETFLRAWKAKNHDGHVVDLPGRNHFTVVHEFLDRASPLYRELSALIEGAGNELLSLQK